MSLEEITRGVYTQIKAETGEDKVAVALIVMTQGEEPDSDSLAAHSVGFEPAPVYLRFSGNSCRRRCQWLEAKPRRPH